MGMNQRSASRWMLFAALLAVVGGPPAPADMLDPPPIESGTGPFSLIVQIDFSNMQTVLFEVFHDGADTTTTYDLLKSLDDDSELNFFLHTQDFGGGLGQFVWGLGYDGSIEDNIEQDFNGISWTYWQRPNLHDPWKEAGEGISSAVADDIDWHGFVVGETFGSGPPRPVPEPASAALLCAGVLIWWRRRWS